jgi:hypothetical protein
MILLVPCATKTIAAPMRKRSRISRDYLVDWLPDRSRKNTTGR